MSESRTPKWVYWVLGAQTVLTVVSLCFTFELRMKPIEMSYQDWIAVLLTALTVLISVLGVFFAVLAVIGWQTIGRQVDRQVHTRTDAFLNGRQIGDQVAKRTESYLEDGFKPKGHLRTTLRDAVEAVSYDLGGDEDDVSDPEA